MRPNPPQSDSLEPTNGPARPWLTRAFVFVPPSMAGMLLLLNLLLAEHGGTYPSLLWLLGVIWILCIIVATAAWIMLCGRDMGGTYGIIGCGLLLVALTATTLTWRGAPTQNLLGVQDEGYNLATAMALLRTGTPSVPPSQDLPEWVWISERPTQAQRAQGPNDVGAKRHALGYLFYDDGGRVRSVFPVGFPMLMAGMGTVFGELSIFWANTLFWVGMAACAGLLAHRYAGPWPGIAAGFLVLCCPLHLWISRSAFAEPSLAFVFMGAVLLFDRVWREADRWQAFAVGVAAMVLPLLKFEGWLGSVLLLGLLPFAFARPVQRVVAAGFGCACVCATAVAVWAGGGGAYMLDTIRRVAPMIEEPGPWLAFALGSAIVLAVFCKYRKRSESRLPTASDRNHVRLHLLYSGGIALAMGMLVFLIWVRPSLPGEDYFYYWPLERDIRSWREHTLPRLGWYIGLPGLVLGFLGVLMLPAYRRVSTTGATLILLPAFLIAFFFLAWDIRNNPVQPYAMRRFVGYGTPLLCLGLASLLMLIPQRYSAYAKTLLTVATTALLVHFFHLADPILVREERQGVYSQVIELGNALGEYTCIVIPVDEPANRLIIPLQLGLRLPVLPVASVGDIYNKESELSQSPFDRPSIREGGVLLTSERNIRRSPYALQSSFLFTETLLIHTAEERPSSVARRSFMIHLLQPQSSHENSYEPITSPVRRTPIRSRQVTLPHDNNLPSNTD